MAISTNNDEYSVAKNQADDLLRRSFAYHPDMSSSNGNEERSHKSSNKDSEFSFVSPSVCSTSAAFFHDEEETKTQIGYTVSSFNQKNIEKSDAVVGSSVSSSSSSFQASDSRPESIQSILQNHLRQIEEEYGISHNRSITNAVASAMMMNNPSMYGMRRFGNKTTTRQKVHHDSAYTIYNLANIIFEDGDEVESNHTKMSDDEDLVMESDSSQQRLQKAKQKFHKFGSSLPKKVCQHPFKRNDIVWVCRTCQADETCVLCHQCYDQSNHEGHDVAFYHAQAGGCCDCGDPDAWDPAGWCPHHGREQVIEFESGLENRVKAVVDCCVEYLGDFAKSIERGYSRANHLSPFSSRNFNEYGESNHREKRKYHHHLGRSKSALNSNEEWRRRSNFDDDVDQSNRSFRRAHTVDMDRSDLTMNSGTGSDFNESMMDMENDRLVIQETSTSLHSTSNHSHASDDNDSAVNECKFNPSAASTSKSRASAVKTGPMELSAQEIDNEISNLSTDSGTFNPEAASTSKSQSKGKEKNNTEKITPAQYLGLIGARQEGLYLLLHADDVTKPSDVIIGLRSLFRSHPHHDTTNLDRLSNQIAHLFEEDIGDIILWGTSELMEELGPVLSACWKDEDALACTRFGALILEKAKMLSDLGMVVSIKTRLELCQEVRCKAVLDFLNLMSGCCDPLCRLVSIGLGAADDRKESDKNSQMECDDDEQRICIAEKRGMESLCAMLQNDLKLPRQISKSWHELLLTLLAVPNFKAGLANAYVDTYTSVTSEYARGVGIFDKSSYTLSVQFLNRVTYVQDLVRERDLLGCLVRGLFRTMSVARKTSSEFSTKDSSQTEETFYGIDMTINRIQDVIDLYLNPRNPWENRKQVDVSPETGPSLNTVLDPLHAVLVHRRYSPCISDLKCVLNVPGISRLFASLPNSSFERMNENNTFFTKSSLLDAWINLLSICQNMNAQRWRRVEEGHVESEPKGWVGAFNADIALGSIYERVLFWDDEDALKDTPLLSEFKRSNRFLSMTELTHYVFVNGVDPWQSTESLTFVATNIQELPEFSSPVCLPMSSAAVQHGTAVAMKALPISQCQSFSFHLPLHRFVASCLRELARHPYKDKNGNIQGIEKLFEYMKLNEEPKKLRRIYQGILEYPLLVLSRNSQIRSDLWLRNGKGMFDQVLNYAEPHFCKALRDADLTLIQFAFIGLMGLNDNSISSREDDEIHEPFSCANVVNLFLHRFGLFEFLGMENAAKGNKDRYHSEVSKGLYPAEKKSGIDANQDIPWFYAPTEDPVRLKSMAEEFLYTIIILITEMLPPPPNDELGAITQAKARLRREIIHRLASGPKAHSELVEVHHVLPMRDNVILSDEGKLVNPDDATGAALEAALVEIADCKSFQGKSDRWELQRWAWNEYDPSFFHLSLRQHQTASEARPNSSDEKSQDITPTPYAPFPPNAHTSFSRLRRDLTSDASIIAVIYRALHVHCRNIGENDKFLENFEDKISYEHDAMSETVLGRAIHLLTLGIYSWESTQTKSSKHWKNDGGGDYGSVFYEYNRAPCDQDWVECILLKNADKVMASSKYESEKNMLELLNVLVTEGGSKHFKVSDKAIRNGAAWICDYAARNNPRAAQLLGESRKMSKENQTNESSETDRQRRSREAKERAMLRMQAQMNKFLLSTSTQGDDSDSASNDKSMTPASPHHSSLLSDDTTTPKTTENNVALFDDSKICKEIPDFPMFDNKSDTPRSKFSSRLFQDRPKCIICAEDGVLETDVSVAKNGVVTKPKKKILTWCGFIQSSTVARGGGGVPELEFHKDLPLVGTHVSLCGHAVHSSCWESHIKDSVQREERLFERYDKKGDYKCPLCRRLTNCLVPFIDVGETWAKSPKDKREQEVTSLDNFLNRSHWWTTRNDGLFVWNGRCSFIPRELWSTPKDSQVQAFGKKDLCKAWSTVLWTSPYLARPVNDEHYIHSNTSSAVTVVWRRILDQISEISYKADSKRVSENILVQNLGEFRHYLVEKIVYNKMKNRTSRNNTSDTTEWPSCMIESPSNDFRQALSREKLLSKIFLSTQCLTYSACADGLECKRLAKMEPRDGVASVNSKFGVDRICCNDQMIIMPLPLEGEGSKLFEGKLGRLRYFALTLSVAIGPVAKEIVHLSMDLPSYDKHKEAFDLQRAPFVASILCGHVLTHTVAALCAVFGRERIRCEAMNTAQSVITNLIPLPEEKSLQDCINFIQLGYIARVLQVLLGIYSQELRGNIEDIEAPIAVFISSLNVEDLSGWEVSCYLILQRALCDIDERESKEGADSHGSLLTTFRRACQEAKRISNEFIMDISLLLQILYPKSISIFESIVTHSEMEEVLRVLKLDTLDEILQSSLVAEILSHWYKSSKPQFSTDMEKFLVTNKSYPVNDWPNLKIVSGVKVPKGHLPLLMGSLIHDNNYSSIKRVKRIASLPTSYTDLYATLGTLSPESELTAVCFVCGQVLDASGKGECTMHSQACGAGCGIFFLLQDCVCIAIHKEYAAYIPSPYVDSHGETPQYRGRPLNIDYSRYEALHELWSGHTLREHVIAERTKSMKSLMISPSFY